jgi:hypothetical protein
MGSRETGLFSTLSIYPMIVKFPAKPRVMARIDLELVGQIPWIWVSFLSLPDHSVHVGYSGRDQEVLTLFWIKYWKQLLAWFILFRESSSFVCSFDWPPIEFSLVSLNLCVWASGFDYKVYKTINFWEQKKKPCLLLLFPISFLVRCSVYNRHILHIIRWLFTYLPICVHLDFRNYAVSSMKKIISSLTEYSWSQSKETWILVLRS